jgi:hypothetical protein
MSIRTYRSRVCTGLRPTAAKLQSGNIEGSQRSASLAPTTVTEPTSDLTIELSRAITLINCDVVQKLVSQWRAANVPIVMVDADVRDGRAVIRIVLERITREIVRHLPCDIDGFPIVVEEQCPLSLH